MRWLDSIMDSMGMNLSKLWEIVKDKQAWHVAVRGVSDAIQPSHPLLPPSPVALNLCQHQGLPMSRLFALTAQTIGASASAPVLPMNIQC